MIKKQFLLCTLLLLSNNLAASHINEDDNIKDHPFYSEGFLRKDEVNFEFRDNHPFVSEKSFDKIHPIAEDEKVDLLTIKIRAQTKEEKQENTAIVGSGIVIRSDGEQVEALTATHVMYDKKTGSYRGGNFTQGQARFGGNLTYLGEADITEVCPCSDGRDIALLKGRYNNTSSEEREYLKSLFAPLTRCTSEGTIYGYPLGIEEQRIRKGPVSCDEQHHQISTLPGDSGAGIGDEKGLFGIHSGGSAKSIRKDVRIEGKGDIEFGEYEYNKFNIITEEDYLTKFAKCYNVKKD